jgi:hypothetical protein
MPYVLAAVGVAVGAFIGGICALALMGTPAEGAFAPDAALGLSPEQLKNATIAMRVADEEKAGPLPVLAMVVSALGESNFSVVPNAKGSGYCGVFQADPDNIPCDDTEQQARSFLRGGKGFQAGGAMALANANPDMSPGTIATLVEASGQPGSFYDAHRPQAEQIIAAWVRGKGFDAGSLPDVPADARLTPKEVIDRYVLPIARRVGVPVTADSVEAANAAHSELTTSGNVSDHKGPPDHAWAADMSDKWDSASGSPNMTHLATVLAKVFKVPGWTGSGLVNNEHSVIGACAYRLQLIYLTNDGGNHFNHVHFGIRLLSCT